MRRFISVFLLSQMTLVQYCQIIADHTIVDRFDDIPQEYINKVKEMWLVYAGESHSSAIRTGLIMLEAFDSKYQVNVTESGTPQPYTNQYLRASRATWGDYARSEGWIYSYGEEDWFTNSTAISRTKDGIKYCNTNSLEIAAIGFGWCWDHVNYSKSSTADPVYGCRWSGTTVNGPSGALPWGIDAADNSITGNTVNMDTYLFATQQYIDYCIANGYKTKVFFTTAPVDTYFTGEDGYQGHLKHEHIRDFVKTDLKRILFDYADILCYDDNGIQTTTTWNGHVYPTITKTNLGDGSIGHIGTAGAIRLAKAMWWMLARIAGWEGKTTLGVNEDLNNKNSIRKIISSNKIELLLEDDYRMWNSGLYNFQGLEIASKPIENDILSYEISLLFPGLYFVLLSNGREWKVEKFVKP